MSSKPVPGPAKRGLWKHKLWHRLHGHVIIQVFSDSEGKRHKCVDCGTIWQKIS